MQKPEKSRKRSLGEKKSEKKRSLSKKVKSLSKNADKKIEKLITLNFDKLNFEKEEKKLPSRMNLFLKKNSQAKISKKSEKKLHKETEEKQGKKNNSRINSKKVISVFKSPQKVNLQTCNISNNFFLKNENSEKDKINSFIFKKNLNLEKEVDSLKKKLIKLQKNTQKNVRKISLKNTQMFNRKGSDQIGLRNDKSRSGLKKSRDKLASLVEKKHSKSKSKNTENLGNEHNFKQLSHKKSTEGMKKSKKSKKSGNFEKLSKPGKGGKLPKLEALKKTEVDLVKSSEGNKQAEFHNLIGHKKSRNCQKLEHQRKTENLEIVNFEFKKSGPIEKPGNLKKSGCEREPREKEKLELEMGKMDSVEKPEKTKNQLIVQKRVRKSKNILSNKLSLGKIDPIKTCSIEKARGEFQKREFKKSGNKFLESNTKNSESKTNIRKLKIIPFNVKEDKVAKKNKSLKKSLKCLDAPNPPKKEEEKKRMLKKSFSCTKAKKNDKIDGLANKLVKSNTRKDLKEKRILVKKKKMGKLKRNRKSILLQKNKKNSLKDLFEQYNKLKNSSNTELDSGNLLKMKDKVESIYNVIQSKITHFKLRKNKKTFVIDKALIKRRREAAIRIQKFIKGFLVRKFLRNIECCESKNQTLTYLNSKIIPDHSNFDSRKNSNVFSNLEPKRNSRRDGNSDFQKISNVTSNNNLKSLRNDSNTFSKLNSDQKNLDKEGGMGLKSLPNLIKNWNPSNMLNSVSFLDHNRKLDINKFILKTELVSKSNHSFEVPDNYENSFFKLKKQNSSSKNRKASQMIQMPNYNLNAKETMPGENQELDFLKHVDLQEQTKLKKFIKEDFSNWEKMEDFLCNLKGIFKDKIKEDNNVKVIFDQIKKMTSKNIMKIQKTFNLKTDEKMTPIVSSKISSQSRVQKNTFKIFKKEEMEIWQNNSCKKSCLNINLPQSQISSHAEQNGDKFFYTDRFLYNKKNETKRNSSKYSENDFRQNPNLSSSKKLPTKVSSINLKKLPEENPDQSRTDNILNNDINNKYHTVYNDSICSINNHPEIRDKANNNNLPHLRDQVKQGELETTEAIIHVPNHNFEPNTKQIKSEKHLPSIFSNLQLNQNFSKSDIENNSSLKSVKQSTSSQVYFKNELSENQRPFTISPTIQIEEISQRLEKAIIVYNLKHNPEPDINFKTTKNINPTIKQWSNKQGQLSIASQSMDKKNDFSLNLTSLKNNIQGVQVTTNLKKFREEKIQVCGKKENNNKLEITKNQNPRVVSSKTGKFSQGVLNQLNSEIFQNFIIDSVIDNLILNFITDDLWNTLILLAINQQREFTEENEEGVLGIRTNINAINEYCNLLINFINKNYKEFIVENSNYIKETTNCMGNFEGFLESESLIQTRNLMKMKMDKQNPKVADQNYDHLLRGVGTAKHEEKTNLLINLNNLDTIKKNEGQMAKDFQKFNNQNEGIITNYSLIHNITESKNLSFMINSKNKSGVPTQNIKHEQEDYVRDSTTNKILTEDIYLRLEKQILKNYEGMNIEAELFEMQKIYHRSIFDTFNETLTKLITQPNSIINKRNGQSSLIKNKLNFFELKNFLFRTKDLVINYGMVLCGIMKDKEDSLMNESFKKFDDFAIEVIREERLLKQIYNDFVLTKGNFFWNYEKFFKDLVLGLVVRELEEFLIEDTCMFLEVIFK